MEFSDDEILEEYVRRFGQTKFSSLEDLFTSERGMGLVTATPVQRAICRIAEGRPLGELANNPDVATAMGLSQPALLDYSGQAHEPPRELVLVSGIRTAKSLLASAIAIWASQTCNIDHLRAGEIPRFSIVSLNKDLANVVLNHLMGSILASESLMHMVYDQKAAKKWMENGRPGSDFVMLKHPSGKPVQIMVVSGKRAGGSLVARWSAGVVFDEASRMVGASEGVVNLDDSRAAVLGRLLPGAQIISIGSPWAPMGPVYQACQDSYGKPTRERVFIKAPGPLLNPYWWTPERCERLRAADPTAHRTDVLAEFADVEESLLSAFIDSSTREEPMELPYVEGAEYICALDPATRGNAWTMVISTREGSKKRVAMCKQWQGSSIEPLRPREVLQDIAECCEKYRITWAYTDQFAADALKDLAEDMGLELVCEEWTRENKVNLFLELRAEMQQGLIEIPPDHLLIKDLRLVKRRVTQTGVAIVFPQTGDKRHCDYAPALAKSISRWLKDIVVPDPKPGNPRYNDFMCEQMLQRELDEHAAKQKEQWWDR